MQSATYEAHSMREKCVYELTKMYSHNLVLNILDFLVKSTWVAIQFAVERYLTGGDFTAVYSMI